MDQSEEGLRYSKPMKFGHILVMIFHYGNMKSLRTGLVTNNHVDAKLVHCLANSNMKMYLDSDFQYTFESRYDVGNIYCPPPHPMGEIFKTQT